jgi:hypothetical protein
MTKGKKPVDAATALVCLDEGHVVDVSSLHPTSLPGELVYAFGQAMGEVADKFNQIHKYVTWLRTQDIRLDTDPLMDQATQLIARAYPDAGSDAVDSYARGLRSLLTCAELPERFSVTNGVSVPCYNFGDLVDVRLVLQQDRMVWFAGVVVDTRHKNQKLSYEVFRLGDPPKGNGKTGIRCGCQCIRCDRILKAQYLANVRIGMLIKFELNMPLRKGVWRLQTLVRFRVLMLFQVNLPLHIQHCYHRTKRVRVLRVSAAGQDDKQPPVLLHSDNQSPVWVRVLRAYPPSDHEQTPVRPPRFGTRPHESGKGQPLLILSLWNVPLRVIYL